VEPSTGLRGREEEEVSIAASAIADRVGVSYVHDTAILLTGTATPTGLPTYCC